MSDWERFGDWIATLTVATFAWVSSALAPELPDTSTTLTLPQSPTEHHQTVMSWAQQVDEPPIGQVGEDAADDVEPLDESGPPAEDGAELTEDIELLDQGEPAAVQEDDIELLDQGSPPAAAPDSPATSTVTVAPTTTYVAPEPTTSHGLVLPEGFGTGNVHVAAGMSGIPVGLENCHVGAVTGRAYVGIDCGEGSSFVGHAPTFENFPFVLDDNFPFDEDSVFSNSGGSDVDQDLADDVEILVSAARGAPLDDDATAPEIRTSGNSSVQFTQRARDRKGRVEAETRGPKQSKDSKKGTQGEGEVAAAEDGDNRTRAGGKDKKQDKDQNSRASDGNKEKKSKSSKKSKKQSGQKGHRSKKR